MSPGRAALSQRQAYALAAGVVGLMLFASVAPSPLYATYAERLDFGPVVLTAVYATYAFGVLVALLLAGRISDDVGRRPVLLVALAVLMVTAVVYMLASSVAALVLARALQGLATGLALATASAALLDLHLQGDPLGVGRTNGVATATGMGAGLLVAASLVEFAPAPRVLAYVVLLVLFALAFVGVTAMPEPVERRASLPRLRPQRPHVPADVRGPFAVAALGVLSSWSVNGLFLALGPRFSAEVLGTANAVACGAAFVVLALFAAAAQLVFGRTAPWRGAMRGSLVLAAGMLVVALAAVTGAPALLFLGAATTGTGFGVAFLGGLRALSAAIAPGQRAEVMAAFYLVAYGALSVPAVLAGVAVTALSIETTFAIFGVLVALLALACALAAWRLRPGSAEPRELSFGGPPGRTGLPRARGSRDLR